MTQKEIEKKESMTQQEIRKDMYLTSPMTGALSSTSHLKGSTSHIAKDSYIRTELPVQCIKQQHTVNLDTKTLLKIEEAKLYLEAKGRSLNTLGSFERHIKQLAKRANLDSPRDVETAIARSISSHT